MAFQYSDYVNGAAAIAQQISTQQAVLAGAKSQAQSVQAALTALGTAETPLVTAAAAALAAAPTDQALIGVNASLNKLVAQFSALQTSVSAIVTAFGS
jgi:hypothetical protein